MKHNERDLHTKDTYGSPDDTIVAIATARGTGAIGIIRISGPHSKKIISAIFKPITNPRFTPQPRVMTLGHIVDSDSGCFIDQVMISFFASPNSYTGENVFEIFCHGGILVTREILSLVIKQGARLAHPGEFTCRAFFNGKMNLTQAESVLDIVNAHNRAFLEAAVKQLAGTLGESLKKQRDRLVALLAGIEVAIEYPEEQIDRISASSIKKTVDDVITELNRIIEKSDSVRLSNEGIKVAIIGKPNVGKSSLMNRLLGHDRVIVSDVPGTTRDLVGDWISSGGIDFLIMDTAGITKTDDKIESEAINRTFSFLNSTDIVLALFDGSSFWTVDDDNVASIAKNNKSFDLIPVITKSDLDINYDTNKHLNILFDTSIVSTSAKTGSGITALFDRLVEIGLSKNPDTSDAFILHSRNRDLLRETVNSLEECLKNLETVPIDILSIDIRDAVDALGKITGEQTTEDILASIFNNFCVGK